MNRLAIESWIVLLHLDLVMRFRDFSTLHEMVRKEEVRSVPVSRRPPHEELCYAVDLACVFYLKRVLCLQRSAATTFLLRRYGWCAEMVIGAQVLPFKSHAWVEVNGAIVNDKSYLHDIYRVLERC
jgi:hypothetical protein